MVSSNLAVVFCPNILIPFSNDHNATMLPEAFLEMKIAIDSINALILDTPLVFP